MCLIVNESGCTTVKLACWSDKWMRLAFCAFLADFNCSFGWSEYSFLSKADNDSLLLLLIFLWKIYLHFLSSLHIHLWFLSYFSKCNYPARLNYGKEIIKIFSCQQSESGQRILGGLNVGYSFFLSIISSFPTPAAHREREQEDQRAERMEMQPKTAPAMTASCSGRWLDCLGLEQRRTPGVFRCWIIWGLGTNLKKGFSVHARIGGDKRRVKD